MIEDVPRLSLAHVDLHLGEAQTAAKRDERRLDLGVVVWVLDGEELDARAVERDEAGRRVRDPLPAEDRDESREHADADAPSERGSVASRPDRRTASR